jgi:hypothetical protein
LAHTGCPDSLTEPGVSLPAAHRAADSDGPAVPPALGRQAQQLVAVDAGTHAADAVVGRAPGIAPPGVVGGAGLESAVQSLFVDFAVPPAGLTVHRVCRIS